MNYSNLTKARIYYLKNKDRIRHYRLNWLKLNKDKDKETRRLYRLKNKTVILQKQKEYYLTNKDKIKLYHHNRKELNTINYMNYYKYNKLKCFARDTALKHFKKDKFCKICNSNINLQFHHTDYKNNVVITLCRTCHNLIPKRCNNV